MEWDNKMYILFFTWTSTHKVSKKSILLALFLHLSNDSHSSLSCSLVVKSGMFSNAFLRTLIYLLLLFILTPFFCVLFLFQIEPSVLGVPVDTGGLVGDG